MNEELKKLYGDAPKIIQNWIISREFTETLKSIYNKNSIRIDKAGDLENEIILTLLGANSPDDFTKAVINIFGEENYATIIEDVDEKIFRPIRDEVLEKDKQPQHPIVNIPTATKTLESDIANTKLSKPTTTIIDNDPYRESIN